MPETEGKWTLLSLLNEISAASQANTDQLKVMADLMRDQLGASAAILTVLRAIHELPVEKPKPSLWQRIEFVFWPE